MSTKLFSFYVLQNLLLSQDIIICIIVDNSSEFQIGGGFINIILMIHDCFNNASFIGLTIILSDFKCLPILFLKINKGDNVFNTLTIIFKTIKNKQSEGVRR